MRIRGIIKKSIIGLAGGAIAYLIVIFLLNCQHMTTTTIDNHSMLIYPYSVYLTDEESLVQEFHSQSDVITKFSFVAYAFPDDLNGNIIVELNDGVKSIAKAEYPLSSIAAGEETVIWVKEKVEQGQEYSINITYRGKGNICIGCGNRSENYSELSCAEKNGLQVYNDDGEEVSLLTGVRYGKAISAGLYFQYLIYVLIFVALFALLPLSIHRRKMKEKCIVLKHHVFAGAVATATAGILFAYFISNQFYLVEQVDFNYNLGIYVLAVITFLAVYLFALNIIKYFDIEIETSQIRWKMICVLIGATAIWFVGRMILTTIWQRSLENVNAWMPMWNYRPAICVIVLALACTIGVVLYSKLKDSKIMSIVLNGLMLLSIAISAFCVYYPNYFAADVYHGDAYYASIYSTLQFDPISFATSSTYGHYSLLFLLPMKLLGGSYFAFNIIMALLVAFQLFCVMYILKCFVKNKFLQLVSMIAIEAMFAWRTSNYWQMAPHRVLFMSIYIALVTKWVKSNYSKKVKIAGYLVGILALIWNFETGIFCIVSWCAMMVYKKMTDYSWHSLAVFIEIAKNIFWILGDFVCAYGIIELYNIIVSGNIYGLNMFIYPLGPGAGVSVGAIMDEYPVSNSAYFYVFILLALCIMLCISKMKTKGQDKQVDSSMFMIVFLTINSITSITYYMNNPYPNSIFIAIIQSVLIMCIWISKYYRGTIIDDIRSDKMLIKSKMCSLLGFTFLASIIMIAVLSTCATVYTVKKQIQNQAYSQTEFEQVCETVGEYLPDDTIGFGEGIAELYSVLGKNPNCEVVTYPGITQPAVDAINQRLKDGRFILTSTIEPIDSRIEIEGYTEVKRFEFSTVTYLLLEKQKRD